MAQHPSWNVVRESFKMGGKEITLETGKVAKQADGAVMVSCNDSRVLVTVVSKKEADPGKDFFPLVIEYQEKYYAAGKIPGGFFKREAKPTTDATLTARIIDRPLRPAFPAGFQCETQVVSTVLSVDGSIEPGVLSLIGASAAIHISDIPFNGPLASCQVTRVDGKLIPCPTQEELGKGDLDITVAGSRTAIFMVEGGANFISEAEMLEGLKFAQEAFAPALEAQERLREKVGKPKRSFSPTQIEPQFREAAESFLRPKIQEAMRIKEKAARYEAFSNAKSAAEEKLLSQESEDVVDARKKELSTIVEDVKYAVAREMIIKESKRIDGRGLTDIRPITTEVCLLPRVHGSALFTRGETQVMGAVTLGTTDDEQLIDSITGNYYKQFLLHYNFPPFSVGEVGRFGGQGRREIGHGALAEKALKAIMPPHKEFPYTVRVVGEVLESNGSTSMGTVCAGCLAMLDAGVPVKEPVSGIAMGLIKEGNDVAILSDILGDEDHLGDMDFKVAGGKTGITAVQMDIKIDGVNIDIMKRALEQAKAGREHILNEMLKTMSTPRKEISQYAPRIETIQIKPDKVREVIGPGGKMIKSIIEATGVKIDIEDDGKIHVSSTDPAASKQAIAMINSICAEAEIGKDYKGKVKKIMDFGAFVEILPGTDGLVHISEISHDRIRAVGDVLKEGDEIEVRVLDVDRAGKIKLSRKVLLPKG